MAKYDFKKDLAFGADAENQFCLLFPEYTVVEIRDYDLVKLDGTKIELKTDRYISNNFFIERWSSKDKEKPGSFWQSREKCDSLIYWFIKQDKVFEFTNLTEVAMFLDAKFLLGKYKPVWLPNTRWTGEGYKIPIEDLSPFYQEIPFPLVGMDG